MDFRFKKEEIINKINNVKLDKYLSRTDKKICISNYLEMLDIITNGDSLKDNTKLDMLFNLIQNKLEYKKDYFISFLPYIEDISSFYNEYKIINDFELPKRIISNNDLISITHDYFNSYNKKDKINIYNKIITNNNSNFINITSFNKSKYMGQSYFFPYNNPQYAIAINKENTITDIITMVHEFEHVFTYDNLGYNTNYDYIELPSEVSTYYLLDYLSKIGFDEKEVITARMMEYNRILYFYYNVYNQYTKIKNNNYLKIMFELIKNKDSELLSKYNIYFDSSFIKERLSGIVALYIYNNYELDESVNEYYNYLIDLKTIYDIAITDTLDILFENTIKNIKILKK